MSIYTNCEDITDLSGNNCFKTLSYKSNNTDNKYCYCNNPNDCKFFKLSEYNPDNHYCNGKCDYSIHDNIKIKNEKKIKLTLNILKEKETELDDLINNKLLHLVKQFDQITRENTYIISIIQSYENKIKKNNLNL